MKRTATIIILFLTLFITISYTQGFEGYYSSPDLKGETLVFVAEGDIWKVSINGGLAMRLTTHLEDEMDPKISPDGKTIAYTAQYEGPREVYTMPIEGGIPTRWTYESDLSWVNSWTPDGQILYDTRAFATLPNRQLVKIDPNTKEKYRIPLHNASEATTNEDGKTLFFVNPSYHFNVTKRYKGGTARQIWKYSEGSPEAIKLTTDYTGESHHPTWYEGRVYFLTDRDGIMNVWSMKEDGTDMQQHTEHTGFDVRSLTVSDGMIVYQLGADLWKYNIETDESTKIDIRLSSDLEQLRENWIEDPTDYITSVHPDKTGDKVVVTARGRIAVIPAKSGRIVNFTEPKNVRYRDAIFSENGKDVIVLSDESGEFEFVSMSANGTGTIKSITSDGEILRYGGVVSPDGKWLAYDDLLNRLFIFNLETGEQKLISTNDEGIATFSWSPDSKWLSYCQTALNTMYQIHIYSIDTEEQFPLTTDRANSFYPSWSPDGKFIYFLSDRNFQTIVGSPWGPRQPEPFFDASEKIYHVALQKGTRSPFRPIDELMNVGEEKKKEKKDSVVNVVIDREGIQERIEEVPIKPGNYRGLAVNKDAIYTISSGTGIGSTSSLSYIKITNDNPEIKSMADNVRSFEMTADGKKLLISQRGNYYIINAGTSPVKDLSDSKINMSGWKFSIDPREDWKQIFTDAWRMERDYFYDEGMHGVNWDAMYEKYFPLVDRITTRNELSDLIGRFVGELAALHTSVRGGEIREDDEEVNVASLGARLERSTDKGGYIIDYIYQADPDYPDEKSPLDDPFLDIQNGDVITSVNGKSALSENDFGALIRDQAGKQVRISLSRGDKTWDAIVVPMANDGNLRYRDWEYTRRLMVENLSEDKIGYVHLRAMGSNDINQWYREFYPVFNRQGLIIDVRHNRGGNIESFILEKLLRKDWMYWKTRSGSPSWNMQYAYRGHIVILVNENTASDGEAFADGFRKLDLGTAIGVRTWGGEIWLSGVNRLSDGGIARAPMMGVYGKDGTWLIEGHGFVPDIEVENLPHATFNGDDAQLKAAIDLLLEQIKEDPRPVPEAPAFPDKSFNNK